MHVAVIDIGKPGKNLGWVMSGSKASEGTDLDECIKVLAATLEAGPLALGFEAPMFVPVRLNPATLTAAVVANAEKVLTGLSLREPG